MVMLAWPSEQPKTTDKLQKTFCLSVGRLQIDYNKTTKKLQRNYKKRDRLQRDYKKTTDKLQNSIDPFLRVL